jgi:hypothetical protein
VVISLSGDFIPGERAHDSQWAGGWVDLIPGLDIVADRNLWPSWVSNPSRPSQSLVTVLTELLRPPCVYDYQIQYLRALSKVSVFIYSLSVTYEYIYIYILGVCGKNIQRVKIEIEGKIIEQVSNFNYLGSLISNEEKDINTKLQRYNKMNGIIK